MEPSNLKKGLIGMTGIRYIYQRLEIYLRGIFVKMFFQSKFDFFIRLLVGLCKLEKKIKMRLNTLKNDNFCGFSLIIIRVLQAGT